MPGRWGLYIAIGWTVLSLLVATLLGPWGFGAAVVGLALAWAYSAPPVRLKRNGWWGNSAVAACYEGLPWFTGAAVMVGGLAGLARSSLLAALYSVGAHGIMTLNDFKSVEGDRRMGIGSLPVLLGRRARGPRRLPVHGAAAGSPWSRLLDAWGKPLQAGVVALLLLAQGCLMAKHAARAARARAALQRHRHHLLRPRAC